MPWMMLVVATVSSLAAAIACYALRLRTLAVMIPVQVVVSFAITYAVATIGMDGPGQELRVALTSLLMALALPTVWLILRAVFGPIGTPETPRTE